ncbi:MAG: hypothetical protein OHK0023_15370 [Anaerolineae bacterium]
MTEQPPKSERLRHTSRVPNIEQQSSLSPSDLMRRNQIFERLLEISLALNANLALGPLLDEIMRATCEIVNAEAASILLYVSNTNQLRFVASNTPGENHDILLKTTVPIDTSVAGEIARSNKPIIIQDAAQDPRIYRPVELSIGFQTRSLLGVPMHIKGTVIGVLEALNKHNGPWTEEDALYAEILASHAAVAIQNARQTEALRKANSELEKLDKVKNDFIAIASHELRTPLSVILGYASILKEEAQGELGDHAESVLNSALQLRSLIEDMTNLRYLHLGKVDLKLELVPCSALVSAVLNDLQRLAEAKGQQVMVNFGDDPSVSVDRGKLAMALMNILNNAIKFTPNGGQIGISVESQPREVWIRIHDSGVGIDAEHISKIFEEFYQAEHHMTRRHNGMGLGLSIARGMIEAHNGRVWAESEGKGRGSLFTVALPLGIL